MGTEQATVSSGGPAAGPRESAAAEVAAGPREPGGPLELLDLVWPGTGLATAARVPRRPTDGLSERDAIELQIDFVTLALTPLEFIQLASFLRMSIDGLLELHPGLQRAVVEAFDLRE